jgi:hypothetical protein
VRHATDGDLDRLEPLLERLRAIDGLRERKRGNFMFRSRAFLHFHEDNDELLADVRLDREFERWPVTTPAQQRRLLVAVRSRCGGA